MTNRFSATTTSEASKTVADDADKYILEEPIPRDFLAKLGATSFRLTVDWLDVAEDSETKVVWKEYIEPSQPAQILLITKVTDGEHRTANKQPISEEEYSKFRAKSICHLEKTRFEFEHEGLSMKYDVFNNHDYILEVDGVNAEARASFDPDEFPYGLSPVDGIDGPAVVDWLAQRHSQRN